MPNRSNPPTSEGVIRNRVVGTLAMAESLASIVNEESENEIISWELQRLVKIRNESQEVINKNTLEFEKRLRQEIVEKVRASGWKNMAGRCSECPKEIEKR